MPNDSSKQTRCWSAHNPPYIRIEAMNLIVERGIRHLMVDLPSVDREEDQGALVAHHRFWQWPDDPRTDCTITELIFVPNDVTDGLYGVMFNVAPFHGDAAPSRPVLLRPI
jgi:kynurenine formamidase